MKNIVVFVLWIISLYSQAQTINVKSAVPLPQDLSARTTPRIDKDSTRCALIKVNIVGVKDMVFPDSVGNVSKDMNEYWVYVSPGLKSFRYSSASNNVNGIIDLDKDWGLDIEKESVYRIVLDTEKKLRSAIFIIDPNNATLIFDGKRETLVNGAAVIDKSIGSYSYKVLLPGNKYVVEGTINLVEDSVSTVKNIALETPKYPYTIFATPINATLYIDNKSYPLNEKINLAEGKHELRLVAQGYNDYEKTFYVYDRYDKNNKHIEMRKSEKIVVHKQRATRINMPKSLYLALGVETYNKDNFYKYKWGIKGQASVMRHLFGIFSFNYGAGVETVFYDDSVKNKNMSICLDVPVQFGVSYPLGKYNQYVPSLLTGVYCKSVSDISSKDVNLLPRIDYGAKITAQLDFSQYCVSFDVCRSARRNVTSYGFKFLYRFYLKKNSRI